MAIIFLRTLVIYFLLLVVMRLLGKRQLGEMELSELVLAVLVADMAANPLQDIGIPLINGLVPILTLFCCELIISGVTLKRPYLRSLFFGRPSILVSHGKIVQCEMRKNRFTADELMQELRAQSIMDLSTVEYAVLETNGKLNIIPFPDHSPATAKLLGLSKPDSGYPRIIINDGKILTENLRQLGKDEAWLKRQLTSRGVDSSGVYLMTANEFGQIYFAQMEGSR